MLFAGSDVGCYARTRRTSIKVMMDITFILTREWIKFQGSYYNKKKKKSTRRDSLAIDSFLSHPPPSATAFHRSQVRKSPATSIPLYAHLLRARSHPPMHPSRPVSGPPNALNAHDAAQDSSTSFVQGTCLADPTKNYSYLSSQLSATSPPLIGIIHPATIPLLYLHHQP